MATHPIKPILEFLIDPELGPNRVKRFWSHVDRGADDQCWDWTGCRGGKGFYGKFSVAGQPRRSNRVAWTIANQQEPGNLIIRHTCDRPICCNPAHLVIGTHQDNEDDKGRRGRPVRNLKRTKGGHTIASLHSENERLRAALLSIAPEILAEIDQPGAAL